MEIKNLNYTAEEINALLEKIENLPTIPTFHEFSYDVYGLNDSQSSGQIQSIIEADSGSWNNFLSNCLKNVLKIKCASSGTGGFYPSLNVQCSDWSTTSATLEFLLGSTLYEIVIQQDGDIYEVSRTETQLA